MSLRQETNRTVDLNTLIRITNIVVTSAKVKTITYQMPSGKTRTISGNIHMGIFGEYSALKSTTLEEITKATDAILNHSLTVASLVGSIDKKQNESLVPLAWQAKHKILIIDEFQSSRKEKKYVIEGFLSLLSDGIYEKQFAVATKRPFKEEDGEFYCRIENGKISIKTRFSLIIASMRPLDEFLRYPQQRAFISRLIPVSFEVDEDTQREILEGFKEIKIEPLPIQEHLTLTADEYKQILDFVYFHGYNKLKSMFRLIETLIRVRAIIGFYDEALFIQIADMYKNAEDIAKRIDASREYYKDRFSSKKDKDRDSRLGGGSPFYPKE
jgi:hypothetical protein